MVTIGLADSRQFSEICSFRIVDQYKYLRLYSQLGIAEAFAQARVQRRSWNHLCRSVNIVHFDGIPDLQATMFAFAHLCIQMSRFPSQECSTVFVATVTTVSMTVLGKGGELSTFVLSILVKVNVAQIHLLVGRCGSKGTSIASFTQGKISW